MPSKLRVRYIFRPLVNLIAKGLSKIGVTPNVATILMLIFAIFSFISLVFFYNLLYFAIFIFITGIMDGVDGAIARLTNKSTKFGGFFDSIMDRFSEFIIFLGLFIFCWDQLLWNLIDMKFIIFISFLASIMISYTRSRAENFYKGDFDVGLMARSERLLYLMITSIIAFFYGFFNVFLFILMWLVIGTGIFRFHKLSFLIKENERYKLKSIQKS
ncbi:MAG: CDP-alcohol phosphatidyltransferase family protein [Promethearchaeota archaeon]|nr:MAG: CDP-alcohol phosphatidyltransferase family protein [Candidatus Lokiarchaeota archaeon]